MVEQPEKLWKYYAIKENDRGAGVKMERDGNWGNTKVNDSTELSWNFLLKTTQDYNQ